MLSFLFTAADRDGKSVAERVEAENLSQARYKLEIQGYSEITFYESELTNEVHNLFSERERKNTKKFLKNQVGLQYDTTITRHLFNVIKASAIFWIIILISLFYNPVFLSFLIIVGGILLMSIISFPVILFNRLHEAHCWGKNREVRFWGGLAKFFNKISLVKIPYFEIDVHLSCADAREGKIDDALMRVRKYQNDPKVSKRIFNSSLVRIYYNARDYDKVLGVLENSLQAGHIHTEELIDYAICLARRHKQTGRAREVLQRVFDRELMALANLFIPYCKGVIEVEDGNFSQAEFYLRQASKEIEPFRKNTYLVGLRSEIKAFLAIVLNRRGEIDEANRLVQEVEPYLIAVNDNELLLRCKNVID